MYLTQNHRSREQIEYLLSQASKEGLIKKTEHSELLKDVARASFETLGFKITDWAQISTETKRSLNGFSEKTGIAVDDLSGWWIYDPNLWLYEKSGEITDDDIVFGTARELPHPSQWFEERKIKIGDITKYMLLVKYPEEITRLLRNGKSLYFLRQYVVNRSEKKPEFTLEETAEFEQIVSIRNKVSGTIFYYGVW